MNANDLATAVFLARTSITKGSRAVVILTPFIIALALSNLVFFIGLFGGITKAADRLIIDTLFSNILIEPEQNHQYISSADEKVRIVDSITGVVAAAPHYKSAAEISFDPNRDGRDVKRNNYSVVSIEPDKEAMVTQIKNHVIEGRYLNEDDRDEILIGVEIAGGPRSIFPKISLGNTTTGVAVGDKLRATYPNGVTHEYTVVGIYQTGSDVTDAVAYVTHKDMEAVLGVRDLASEILVKTSEEGTEPQIVQAIRNRGVTDDKISTWSEFLNYTATLKRSFDFLRFVTGVVSMIVVNVTVFIVIFINVVNKRRQLGILRAMGIEENTITASYVLQTVFYCVVGIVLSLVLMYGVLLPYFNARPLDVGFGTFGLIFSLRDFADSALIIVITNIIAGFIPALWAIRRETIIRSIWGV